MIQKSWYLFLRNLFKIGLFFYLKKLLVKGTENIPKKGAVVFIGNHQNAFIDAILIPVTNKRTTYFLARSNPFQNKYIAKILKWSNMYPVYRTQDGVNTLKRNHKIFEDCHEILKAGKGLEIFGEGIHHLDRKVYPLKKGFARIIHGTLEKYPHVEIKIVPVGINFDYHVEFPSSASIIYGAPINANRFINFANPDAGYRSLTTEVRKELKKLTLHVEEKDNYEEVIEELEGLGINYLDPEEAYITYQNRIQSIKKVKTTKIPWYFKITNTLWKINSFIPLILWRLLKGKITEIIFTSTFRFAFSLVIFPIIYGLQSVVLSYFFSWEVAVFYFFGSVLLSLITVKKGIIPKSGRLV